MYMRYWLFYCLSVMLLFLGTMAIVAMPANVGEQKKILIINSYSEHIQWSKDVVDSLEAGVHRKYPDWTVCSGDMKTESLLTSGVAALTLRSLLWKYSEQTKTNVEATSLQKSSIFMQDDVPDAIVWIGDEGFLHYITYALMLGNWKHIPMVLCAVKDSVSGGGWYPELGFNFDKKLPIRNYATISGEYAIDNTYAGSLRGDNGIRYTKVFRDNKAFWHMEISLNYCGNIVQLPIRQNLELIHRLLPNLEELIWVDDNFYRSVETRLEVEKLLRQMMPKVKYSAMIHNRMNTDSIYNVMLKPAKNRAFLTYSWRINGLHSKRSDREIDSLFTYVSSVPMFTLTERNFKGDNYWIGGCFLNNSKIIDRTMAMLERAVAGDSIMTLPFDTVSDARIILNRTALKRYKLTSAADELEGVTYVHIPPAFYQEYERQLLIAILVLAVLSSYFIILWRRARYTKRLQTDYVRYKFLYDKLQAIYSNSSIDFALYAEDGKCLLRIINGEIETRRGCCDLFCDNLFQSSFFNDDLKKQIQSKKTINCEVSLDSSGQLSRTSFTGQSVYQLIVKPLHEVKSHTSCFMAIAINLTPVIHERQEKEKFESLFHFASDSSQVGVVFYDITTAVGMATSSWCTNLNEKFTSGTFPTYEQVMAEDRIALLNFQQAVCTGNLQEPLCKDIRVKDTVGNIHWVRQHMYIIPASNRLVELSLNINEQKQNEQSLEEAKVKAEASNEETSQFLSSISHEVRTPLNAIVGFSTVLSDLDDEETGKEFASIILRNAYLLNALMTNILDLSALDAGKVSFSYAPVNIAEVFTDMGSYIRNNLYDHSLQVIHELPKEADRFLTTDREYLKVLLINLLSNAMKFTHKGNITIGCRKEGKSFYFYITDTGCGISQEDQQCIFSRFTKLDSYIQGTGLGLSLCKSVVKCLGGEIGVISEKGKGSTFWFVLPDKK